MPLYLTIENVVGDCSCLGWLRGFDENPKQIKFCWQEYEKGSHENTLCAFNFQFLYWHLVFLTC